MVFRLASFAALLLGLNVALAATCASPTPNVDYPGNDITATQQGNAADCCADCGDTPGCKLFVWTSFNGGTCWLKRAQGKSSPLPGAWSATIRRSANSQCTPLESNTDYEGNDLCSTARPDASQCCSDCRAATGCTTFVWTQANGGTCWLKSAKGKKVTKAGAFASAYATAPLRCTIPEENVDYAGFDIASTQQSDSSNCCDDCQSTPNCKVFVWTGFNGGTCWLKSDKGAKTTLMGAKASSTVLAEPLKCTPLKENTDYIGRDISSTQRADPADCCNDCQSTPRCKHFVWTGFNGGTCWLKDGRGVEVPLDGARAGSVTRKPASQCDITQDNVDYSGNDIRATSRASAPECCADCADTPGCALYVWTQFNNGTCWLKDRMGAASTLDGAKSGFFAKDLTIPPTPVPTPDSTPEPTPVPTPESTPDSTPESTPASTPDATPEPTPNATPVSTPESTPDATPESTPETTPQSTPEPTPEATPDATPASTPEATPESTPDATPEVTPDSTPAATPESTPQSTPMPTPEATPDSTPEATPESTPDSTPEATPDSTPASTPQSTPDTTPDATPEATPDATPASTPEPTPESTPAATPEATPDSTPVATPDSTPAPTPQATPMSTPVSTPESTPVATPNATPAPTPQPTQTSTPEPTPEPTSGPSPP